MTDDLSVKTHQMKRPTLVVSTVKLLDFRMPKYLL